MPEGDAASSPAAAAAKKAAAPAGKRAPSASPKKTAASGGSKKLPHKERVEALLRKYDPSKVPTAGPMLSKFAGKEEMLIASLVKRYGPEPEPPASSGAASPSASPTKKGPAAAGPKKTPGAAALSEGGLPTTTGPKKKTPVPKKSTGPSPPAAAGGAKKTVPAAPAAPSSKVALVKFFQKYCPQKVATCDRLLAEHQGKEGELFDKLEAEHNTHNYFAAQRTLTPPSSAAGSGSSSPAPLASSPSHVAKPDLRPDIVKFYEQYCPEKVAKASSIMAAFRGRELDMFKEMEKTYKCPGHFDSIRPRYDPSFVPGATTAVSDTASVASSAAAPATGAGSAAAQQPLSSAASATGSTASSSAISAASSSPPTGEAATALKPVLVKFYQKYAPEKVANINAILKAYSGREAKMTEDLEKTYKCPGYFAEARKKLPPSSGAAATTTVTPAPATAAPTTTPAAAAAADTARPTSPTVSSPTDKQDYRARYVQLCNERAPHELKNADRLLAKYKGKEQILLSAMEKRYPPKQVKTPSGTTPSSPTGASASAAAAAAADAPQLKDGVESSFATVAAADASAAAYNQPQAAFPTATATADEDAVVGENDDGVPLAEDVGAPPPPPMADDAGDDDDEDFEAAAVADTFQQRQLASQAEDVWSYIPLDNPDELRKIPPPPPVPAFASYKEQLEALCLKYCPDKMKNADQLLSIFAGREHEMFVHLHAKYKVTSSKEYSAFAPLTPAQQARLTIDEKLRPAIAMATHYGLGPQYVYKLVERFGPDDTDAVMFELLCILFPDAVYNAFADEKQRLSFVSRRLAEFYSFHRSDNVPNIHKIMRRYKGAQDLQAPMGDVLIRYHPETLQKARVQSFTWEECLGPSAVDNSKPPAAAVAVAAKHDEYKACCKSWAMQFGRTIAYSRSTPAALEVAYCANRGLPVLNPLVQDAETSTAGFGVNVAHAEVMTEEDWREQVKKPGDDGDKAADGTTMTDDYRLGPSYNEQQAMQRGALNSTPKTLQQLRQERHRDLYGTAGGDSSAASPRRTTNPLSEQGHWGPSSGGGGGGGEDGCQRCTSLQQQLRSVTQRLSDSKKQLEVVERARDFEKMYLGDDNPATAAAAGAAGSSSNPHMMMMLEGGGGCGQCTEMRRQVELLTTKLHVMRSHGQQHAHERQLRAAAAPALWKTSALAPGNNTNTLGVDGSSPPLQQQQQQYQYQDPAAVGQQNAGADGTGTFVVDDGSAAAAEDEPQRTLYYYDPRQQPSPDQQQLYHQRHY